MSSSRTRNALTLMSGPFQTISHHWDVSASSAERTTLMEVLISMFSAISAESFDPDERTSLMCTVTTRTSSGLSEILGRARSTQQRTERLWPAASTEEASLERLWSTLKVRGLRSSAAKIEQSFLKLLRIVVHGTSLPNLGASTSLPSGSGPSSAWNTSVPPGSCLQMEIFLTWLNTEVTYWSHDVCILPVACGDPPPRASVSRYKRSRGPPPLARGRGFSLEYRY